MSDYEHTIVCGILQKPTRIADVSRLRLDYFQERETKALFALTRKYHSSRGRRNTMDLPLARAKLEESESKLAVHLLALLDEYEELEPVSDSEFREALEQLVVVHREDIMKRHGSAALEAMVDGDFAGAQVEMRRAILEAQDADLDDDRPFDIRSPAAVAAERVRIDTPPERDDSAGFDVGFPRLMRAVKFRRKELTILGGYAADGKGNAHGTPILTPSGWIPIEDLREGDEVIGSDGFPTRVSGVFPRGRIQVFRVTFNDGTSTLVDGDHLWAVKSDNDVTEAHYREDWRVIDTRTLSRDVKTSAGRTKWRIPLVEPVEFKYRELPVHPYVLGVLLGDGSITQDTSVSFTAIPSSGVHQEVRDALLGVGKVRKLKSKDRTQRWSILGMKHGDNPVKAGLVELGLTGKRSWEKVIPAPYLVASKDQRLALLQGLVDTDGHAFPGGRPNCVFNSASEQLALGVVELVRSLGGIARKRKRTDVGYWNDDGVYVECRPSHEVCLTLPAEVCPVRAKRDDAVDHTSRALCRKITSIESEGRAEVTCISVEAKDSLYVIESYLVTHNTQFSKALVSNANQNGANVLYVALEMTRDEVRAMFVAQHCARLDPRGVPWVEAMDGHLNAGQRKLWHRALDDFEVVRHEDHEEISSQAGKMIVWAPTRRITQADWATRLRAAKQEDEIDIAVKDYTELVKPTPKKGFANYRLDLKEMIEEDKGLARELDIWVIDNHQISRKGRDDAEKRKPPHYLKRDLGESSGLERAADHVLWIYSDHDLKDDKQALAGIAKARKGNEIVHGIRLFADFANSNMAPIAADIRR